LCICWTDIIKCTNCTVQFVEKNNIIIFHVLRYLKSKDLVYAYFVSFGMFVWLHFCVTRGFAIRELELYGVKITGREKRLEGQKEA